MILEGNYYSVPRHTAFLYFCYFFFKYVIWLFGTLFLQPIHLEHVPNKFLIYGFIILNTMIINEIQTLFEAYQHLLTHINSHLNGSLAVSDLLERGLLRISCICT